MDKIDPSSTSSLEELCEIISKQVIEQNKSIVDVNQNLLSEIRNLREIIAKQDEDYVETKLLLNKIFDINRQILQHTLSNQQFVIQQNLMQQQHQQQQRMPIPPPPVSQPPPPHILHAQMMQYQQMNGQPQQIQMMPDELGIQKAYNQLFTQNVCSTPIQSQQQKKVELKQQLTQQPTQSQPPPAQPQQESPVITQANKKQHTMQTSSTQQQPPSFSFSPQQPPKIDFFKQNPPAQTTNIFSSKQSQVPFSFADLAKSATTASISQQSLTSTTTKPSSLTPNGPLFDIAKPTEPPKITTHYDEAGGEDEEAGGNPEEYEPQVDFKPLVKLDEVEVKTGEEDEEAIFKERCKLYRFISNEWKEKGAGEMKVLKHKTHGTYRILMRRDQVLKLCANHRVTTDLKLEKVTEKQWRWFAQDYSESEMKSEVLLAKFGNEDAAKRFNNAIEKAKSDLSLSQTQITTSKTPATTTSNGFNILSDAPKTQFTFGLQATTSTTPTTNMPTFKLGQTQANTTPIDYSKPGFTFNISPAKLTNQALSEQKPFKAETPVFEGKSGLSFSDLAKTAPASSSPFAFAGLTTSTTVKPLFGQNNEVKPLFGGTPKATEETQLEGEGDETGGNPEEYEPQVDFKPLVKLDEVEVKTGEEDEEAIFKERCKLYRFISNEWKEKGSGEMKVLRHKTNNTFRILMRRDQVLKLCANHRITDDIKLEKVTEKQWRWFAQDYSGGEAKGEILIAKFRHEDEAKRFAEAVEKAKNNSTATKSGTQKPIQEKIEAKKSTPLSELFKKDANSWTCTGCYVVNKPDIVKCIACQTLKPGASEPVNTAQTLAPGTAGSFSFGQPTKPIGTAPLFGTTSFIAPKTQNETSKPLFSFGALTSKSQETNEVGSGSKPALSFAELAKGGISGSSFGTPNGGFMFSQPSNTQTSLFGVGKGLTPTPLFNASKAQDETEAGEAEEAGGNPEEYEPQVDFKPLVKLSEVEVKSGEEDEEAIFKERCKLYRFISNEWKEKGSGEMKVLRHKTNNTFRILMRRDQVLKLCANHRITDDIKLEKVTEKQWRWFAQDYSEGEAKGEILIAKFRHEDEAKRFAEAVEKAKKESRSGAVVKDEANLINTLASSLKITNGINGNNDDEIQICKELRASKDQVAKARSLGLPDNFYLYENKPNCPGCIGCPTNED